MTTEAEVVAESIEGPALIGIIINIALYGAMFTQTFFYFSTHKSDAKWMKFYVALLFFADTMNTVFNATWIYGLLINHFGDVAAISTANWLFRSDQAMTGIISMQVQFFYAWRIYKLTGNKLLVASVVTTSTVGGLCGIGTAIGVGFLPQFAGFQRLSVIVSIWLAGSAISDVIIAVALTWYLHKKRTGFAYTDTVISKMMHLIMSNGALTATFAVGDMIAFLASPKAYHLILNYPLAKLYGNSALSSLNARAILSNSATSHPSYQADGGPRLTARTNDITSIVKNNAGRTAQIMVNVETHEMADVNPQDDKLRMEWQDHSVDAV